MDTDSGTDFPTDQVLEHEKHLRSADLRERVADYLGSALVVLSLALPLWVVYLSLDAIAGKETVFDAKIGMTFAGTLGGSGVTALVAWLKNRSQKHELKRLRRRVFSLEKRLGIRSGEYHD